MSGIYTVFMQIILAIDYTTKVLKLAKKNSLKNLETNLLIPGGCMNY